MTTVPLGSPLVRALPEPSERARQVFEELRAFMADRVLPAEADLRRSPGSDPLAVVAELKAAARARGLWNLFLPAASGLTQLEYAPLAELTGWAQELGPEAVNCSAPDTGNMELLHLFGTPAQQRRWLEPLLAGEIRSAFAMTEPEVASSDATNIATRIQRDGDSYVISGRKWWASGACDPRCRVLIVMGKTDPGAEAHRQQSMVLVPVDAPGVRVLRSTSVFGHHDPGGHAEVHFEDVRVPVSNLLGEQGGGFAAAQARLGPGRIHHCMRALGAGERALALAVARVGSRRAFGRALAEQDVVRHQLAECRLALEQARAVCHQAAHAIDVAGNRAARDLVSLAKVAVPRAVLAVLDRAIQLHGGAGVSADTPLATMWGWHRAMRIFDGPDEVHLRSLGIAELRAVPTLARA